jgi:hypothetical protein
MYLMQAQLCPYSYIIILLSLTCKKVALGTLLLHTLLDYGSG